MKDDTLESYGVAKGIDTDDDTGGSRRYVCTSCDTVVRARWHGSGSFEVGCECTTVPVVPQMGQAETASTWRVEREACCRDAEAKELAECFARRGADYECPDCGARYQWDGTMVEGPEVDDVE